VPGRSYAFDIAARIGMPAAVLDRARVLMDAGNLGLEETLRNLQEREQALERSNQALETARRELEQAKEDLAAQAEASEEATAALSRREHELAVRSREAVDAAVREARDAITEIVREAKRTRTAQAVEAARAALDRKAKEATAALPEAEPLDVTKLRQALANRALGVSSTSKKASTSFAKASDRPDEPVSMQTGANTLDLRGQRADEALAELEAFLDRTALEGADVVFVIHGHGTGALRKVVREYLATSPYVERFRPGGKGEGGDGVSVASLRG
jgi:DNA mismatch repair protein MutS2